MKTSRIKLLALTCLAIAAFTLALASCRQSGALTASLLLPQDIPAGQIPVHISRQQSSPHYFEEAKFQWYQFQAWMAGGMMRPHQ